MAVEHFENTSGCRPVVDNWSNTKRRMRLQQLKSVAHHRESIWDELIHEASQECFIEGVMNAERSEIHEECLESTLLRSERAEPLNER